MTEFAIATRRVPHSLRPITGVVILAVALSFGCWEQMDDGKWFPQMKRAAGGPGHFEFVVLERRSDARDSRRPTARFPLAAPALPDLASPWTIGEPRTPSRTR